MATYTYKCSDCGVSFNIEATIQEKEEGKSEKFMCPKCRSTNIKQEFSVTNFVKNVFKGDREKCDCRSDKSSCFSPKKDGGSCCG